MKLLVIWWMLPLNCNSKSILFLIHSDCMYVNISSNCSIPVLANSTLVVLPKKSFDILFSLLLISNSEDISLFSNSWFSLYSKDFCLWEIEWLISLKLRFSVSKSAISLSFFFPESLGKFLCQMNQHSKSR